MPELPAFCPKNFKNFCNWGGSGEGLQPPLAPRLVRLCRDILILQVKCSWNIPCSSEGEGRTFVSHLKMGDQQFFLITT